MKKQVTAAKKIKDLTGKLIFERIWKVVKQKKEKKGKSAMLRLILLRPNHFFLSSKGKSPIIFLLLPSTKISAIEEIRRASG